MNAIIKRTAPPTSKKGANDDKIYFKFKGIIYNYYLNF